MSDYAPIALFVYNRPDHTRRTVEALLKNKLAAESDLVIFADGEKKPEDAKVAEVRNYISSLSGFRSLRIVERPTNFGLAKNIIEGVSEVLETHESIIVLEDDILTSPGFLKYMNDALTLYRNEPRVMHVSGYFPPTGFFLSKSFFFCQTSCWGWGTWRRAWKYLDTNPEKLISAIEAKNYRSRLNIDESYPFFEHLQKNATGQMKTWAVKWHASVILRDGLCLHPNSSFVENIGFDDSGSNCRTDTSYKVKKLNRGIRVNKLKLAESSRARKAVARFNVDNHSSKGNAHSIRSLIKRFLK